VVPVEKAEEKAEENAAPTEPLSEEATAKVSREVMADTEIV